MAKVDDVLSVIASVKAKVLELQAKIDAGGMSAAEEAQVVDALNNLKETVDPAVPNPAP